MFRGVGVALATLFGADGDVDVEATTAHARRVVDAGVRGVVVAGSTGEAAALTVDERLALLDAVRAAVSDDVAVLAGTGAASARQAARLTAEVAGRGIDGMLVLSPPRSDDPRDYYREVVAAADGVPVLAYHYPSMSPPGIPVEALGDLAGLGVAGIKDSSGDPVRLLRTLEVLGDGVYTGAAPLLAQAGAVGCAGAILALANVDPAGCVAAFAGDGRAQRALLPAHLEVAGDWPRGLKRAMADRFGTSTVCRMG